MKKNIIIGASLLIVGIVSGLFLCRSCSTLERVEIVQRDSVVVRDTIREYYPLEIKTERVDTMLVVVRDTVRIKDTLYMNLPMQRRTYKRDDFYAEVTGYDPRLTYIEVYPKTVYINESVTMQPHRWQFSLDLGVDVGKDYNPYITPNLGAEIGFKKWSVKGEIGCGLDVMGREMIRPSLYYEIGFKYSLIKR